MADPGKPDEENQSFKTYLDWLQCICQFSFSSCEHQDYVMLSISRMSASLRHLMACSLPSRIRLMCPYTLRGGRHTILMSCYYFPMRTRLPSSRPHPAHLSDAFDVRKFVLEHALGTDGGGVCGIKGGETVRRTPG